jgi:hypothetical protein
MSAAEDNPGSASPAELRLWKTWYLLGGLMLLGVAVGSLIPAPDVGVGDKLSHFIVYFALGGWFGLLASNRAALFWSFAGLFAFGVLLELLQGMTAYRYAEMADVLANVGGCLLGLLLYFTPLKRLFALVDRVLARSLLR